MNIDFKTLFLSLTISFLFFSSAKSSYEMPEDITLVVFNFLPTATLVHSANTVCKKWNEISKKNILWEGLTVKASEKILPEYVLNNLTVLKSNNTDHCVSVLPKCLKLVELYLDNPFCNNDAYSNSYVIKSILLKLKNFKKLTLNNCDLKLNINELSSTDQDCAELIISYITAQLTDLNLSSNNICDLEAKSLLDVIITGIHPKDLKLNLSSNNICNFGEFTSNDRLGEFVWLKELDLSNNQIGDHIAELLSEFLKSAPNLKILNICNNKISEEKKEEIKSSIGPLIENLII